MPYPAVAVDRHELSMICTQTTFGTAVDVTLSELSSEGFYSADDRTARRFAGAPAL